MNVNLDTRPLSSLPCHRITDASHSRIDLYNYFVDQMASHDAGSGPRV
ncbi:MAG: hypothetical protein ABI284_08090 [Nitrosospira sp.]